MDVKQKLTYKYRFDTYQFFNLFLGLGLTCSAIFFYFRFNVDNTLATIIGLLLIMGFIPLLLCFNYFYHSKGYHIEIDESNDSINIVTDKHQQKYRISEIVKMKFYKQQSLGRYGFYFNYVKYYFANNKSIVATSFMTDDFFIPFNIGPIIKKQVIPLILKGNK